MNTQIVTLIAALVAAIAGVTSAFCNRRGALELEKAKWTQAREEVRYYE